MNDQKRSSQKPEDPSRRKPILEAHHSAKEERPLRPFQLALYEVIFEADTPGGKLFDVALLVAIVLSVLTVILESVTGIREDYGSVLYAIEWIFTLLFTVEYLLRLVSVLHPAKYALSFFGLIDLLAIIPTYLSLFLTGAQTLLVIRVFRLLRLFRIFKLTRYIGEARILRTALEASRYKITVFLLTVMAVVVLIGSLMYLIEGPTGGFTSIPRGIYWAIVTMTTVGYGDIAPQTVLGQAIAALLMITGYGVIAVPTGIVSAELTHLHRIHPEPIACPGCGGEGHESDARHCKYCGTRLLDG